MEIVIPRIGHCVNLASTVAALPGGLVETVQNAKLYRCVLEMKMKAKVGDGWCASKGAGRM